MINNIGKVFFRINGVLTKPGQIVVILIPARSNEYLHPLAIVRTAALDPE
jgi:hypothetical protein